MPTYTCIHVDISLCTCMCGRTCTCWPGTIALHPRSTLFPSRDTATRQQLHANPPTHTHGQHAFVDESSPGSLVVTRSLTACPIPLDLHVHMFQVYQDVFREGQGVSLYGGSAGVKEDGWMDACMHARTPSLFEDFSGWCGFAAPA